MMTEERRDQDLTLDELHERARIALTVTERAEHAARAHAIDHPSPPVPDHIPDEQLTPAQRARRRSDQVAYDAIAAMRTILEPKLTERKHPK